MIYLGIDPGIYGALAMLHSHGYAEVYDAPIYRAGGKNKFDDKQAAMMVKPLAPQGCIAAVETTYMGYKSAENIGKWKGILAAVGIPYLEVYPVHWQTFCGIYGKKGKEPSIKRAQEKWPSLNIADKEDGKADAINIADWCRGKQG